MSILILGFHVPETHVEAVKAAVFSAGAGSIGLYQQASWQTLGTGQFLPLPGSQPYLGQHNQLEQVKEFKVETVCAEELIHNAIQALKQAHPYEQPWYYVLRPMDL